MNNRRLKKSHGRISELKQVQLTPQIGQHDIDTKARHAREFLEEGDKVEICVVFKGRQMSHKEVGEDVMKRFVDQLADVSVIDKAPYWEGKWYNAVLAVRRNN